MMLLAFKRYHHIQYYKDGQSRLTIAYLNNMHGMLIHFLFEGSWTHTTTVGALS